MAWVSAPLTELLKSKLSGIAIKDEKQIFRNVNYGYYGYYDPSKPLTLLVDASSKGLGAVLFQDGKPLAYASRALTPTQHCYTRIEKET